MKKFPFIAAGAAVAAVLCLSGCTAVDESVANDSQTVYISPQFTQKKENHALSTLAETEKKLYEKLLEAVNNFANRRYEGFPIGRQQPQAQPQETYQNLQNEPSAFRNEPKADYVKNDGVQTSRLQVEDNDIPPYLRKLREHR